MRRSRALVVLAALICAGPIVPLDGEARSGASLEITPIRSPLDAPLRITVGGLAPGRRVAVRVRSRDGAGVVWTSSSTFVASTAGQVVVDRSAPVSGSYSGVDPMGPFDAMTPAGYHPDGVFYSASGGSPDRFSVSAVVDGRVVASREVERSARAKGETMTVERISSHGFFGDYYSPAVKAGARRAAVLLIGGSNGGLGDPGAASLLAAHGFPALAIAYFKEPGLPQTLTRIPLEYFTRALAWLARQPGVDPRRIFVSGTSRGSEAALLLAADFPDLVHGVIANVPSSVVNACYPCAAIKPAWTLGGIEIPFFPPAAAAIRVEKIRGPLFLDCGDDDGIWPSCEYAHAIVARLKRHHATNPVVLLAYPESGHELGALVPYEPQFEGANVGIAAGNGEVPDANHLADADLWPRLLAFLRRYS